MRRRADLGQVAPLLALVIALAAGACLALVRIGGLVLDRARAQTAADAAALAGAAAGRDAAATLAERNGARLRAYVEEGADAMVTVEVGSARAEARARRVGGGSSGLAPAVAAALARAQQLLDLPIAVAPWANGDDHPERDLHVRGLAVDVVATVAEPLARVAPQLGLCRPEPERHPSHFRLCAVGQLEGGR